MTSRTALAVAPSTRLYMGSEDAGRIPTTSPGRYQWAAPDWLVPVGPLLNVQDRQVRSRLVITCRSAPDWSVQAGPLLTA